MGENWYRFAIDEIKQREKRMTKWEKEYIEVMEKKIRAGLFLTEVQESKILEIHRKVTELPRIFR